MLSESVRRYIVDFLIGRVRQLSSKAVLYPSGYDLIGYTNDPKEMEKYPIVIKPCGFFDDGIYSTSAAEPKLPLPLWEGIPLLFGLPTMEEINDGETLVIHADLIASTYYLISRYEEMTKRPLRDLHGRFPGIQSLPYRAGFINRPIVDEYGAKLREIIFQRNLIDRLQIKIEGRPARFSKVNLTCDVDQPYKYHSLRSILRAIVKEKMPIYTAIKHYLSPAIQDPYFTFNKMLLWHDTMVEKLRPGLLDSIFFIKTQSRDPHDKPSYDVRSIYMRRVISLIRAHKAKIGVHFSYAAGINPSLVADEKYKLQRHLRIHNIISSRHHFLSFREPEDAIVLQNAGIKHDYSMGYADIAGFRLGTCRPVRFINPNIKGLTNLVMHPLYVMDYTLVAKRYMNLDKDVAETLVMNIVEQVAKYNGELNLLWHNESFSVDSPLPWLGLLYRSILRRIVQIENRADATQSQTTS